MKGEGKYLIGPRKTQEPEREGVGESGKKRIHIFQGGFRVGDRGLGGYSWGGSQKKYLLLEVQSAFRKKSGDGRSMRRRGFYISLLGGAGHRYCLGGRRFVVGEGKRERSRGNGLALLKRGEKGLMKEEGRL